MPAAGGAAGDNNPKSGTAMPAETVPTSAWPVETPPAYFDGRAR
jgi:hypothetical protein